MGDHRYLFWGWNSQSGIHNSKSEYSLSDISYWLCLHSWWSWYGELCLESLAMGGHYYYVHFAQFSSLCLITQECCISNVVEVFMQVLGPINRGMVTTSSLSCKWHCKNFFFWMGKFLFSRPTTMHCSVFLKKGVGWRIFTQILFHSFRDKSRQS